MAGASINNAHIRQYHTPEKQQSDSVTAATSSSHTFGSKDSGMVPSGDSLASDTTTTQAVNALVSSKIDSTRNASMAATATITASSIEDASENVNYAGVAVTKGGQRNVNNTYDVVDDYGDNCVSSDGPHALVNNCMPIEPPPFSSTISSFSGRGSYALANGSSGNASDANNEDIVYERNYVDRFGSYSDYLAIVGDSASTENIHDEQQKHNNVGLDNDEHIHSADDTAFVQQQQPNSLPPPPPPPPPLRSTYKSEPLISTIKQIPRVAATKDVNVRNSYSRTLENALFYSQAVEQIRELDIADASNPYAAAMPRARPGKENIRQRRARNVTASREVFSIVNTGSYIPAVDLPPMPDPRLAIERSRAMRSEPSFKTTAPPLLMGKHSNDAVPISKLLPRTHDTSADAVPMSSTHSFTGSAANSNRKNTDEFLPRRAGFDQPVPLTDGGRAESVKQRGAVTPHTFSSSSSVRPSTSREVRQRGHNTAESDILGSELDDKDSSVISSPQTTTRIHRNRLSVVSYFSSISAAPTEGGGELESLGPERLQKQDFIRPATGVPGKGGHHHSHNHHRLGKSHHHQLSSHSKKVATRLLMRAGLSSIAIRVARIGHGHGHALHRQAGEDESEDMGVSFDAASVTGVELDPNGLQGLKTERRKQVKHIDEFGFMEFEGDGERESEHTQQYKAWRMQKTGKVAAHRLERQLQMESAELHAGSETKWETLLASFDRAALRGSRKVKKLVQAGVPQRLRGRFYYVLSGASAMERPGEYARLLALEDLPIFDVIERDVPRCYPDHVMFADADGQGQRQLRRILRAYAQHNAKIGYCQGMGRLVGLFLISGLSEEHAFWVLAAVIQNYIPQYYESDLGGLRVHTAAFEMMLQEHNPHLHAHLAEQGCEALMYATPWFMTVFTLSLPWAAALRVWDWFVYRGPKVLFRVALGITDLASAYLLDACPTIAELLGFLLHIPRGLVEADVLVAAAMRVKLSERHIDRLTQASSTVL